MRYETVMDLHTHTIASGHAYNTLREMAKAAADRGLEILGITEHAPMMPGTWRRLTFFTRSTSRSPSEGSASGTGWKPPP